MSIRKPSLRVIQGDNNPKKVEAPIQVPVSRELYDMLLASRRGDETIGEALERLVRSDSLTGLGNRREFKQDIEIEVDRYNRYGTHFSILNIDLKKFKGINDTFGHEIGDDALKAISAVLVEHLRKSDHAYRLGGDEFVVILGNTSYDDAVLVADKIKRMLQNGRLHEIIRLQANIGVAEIGTVVNGVRITTAECLMEVADKKMYADKRE